VTILALFLVWMVFSVRAFCRTACPLGAFYGLFNKVSALRMVWVEESCTHCGKCLRDCPMGLDIRKDANHPDCIRCLKCSSSSCQFGAIQVEFPGSRRRPAGDILAPRGKGPAGTSGPA